MSKNELDNHLNSLKQELDNSVSLYKTKYINLGTPSGSFWQRFMHQVSLKHKAYWIKQK